MRERNDEVIEIDLREILGLLWSKAWFLVLCTVVGGVVAFLISFFVITPMYQSTTRVYILNKDAGNSITYSDTQLAAQLTKDYESLIKGRTVLEQVLEQFPELQMGYAAFNKRVQVDNPTGTRIISITVEDENPLRAQQLADCIREMAAIHIQNVTDVEAVNVADVANLPITPSSPNIYRNTAIGIFLGMILSMAVVIVRFLLDDTIKSSDDIEKYLGLSTLALIPDSSITEKKKGKKKKRKYVEEDHVDEPAEEQEEDSKKSVVDQEDIAEMGNRELDSNEDANAASEIELIDMGEENE